MIKKTIILAVAAGAALSLSSCNSCTSDNSTTEQKVEDALVAVEEVVEAVADEIQVSADVIKQRIAEAAHDVYGTFEGTLPCADCPGIKTELTINGDLTYTLKEEYLERDSIFTENGQVVNLENGILTLKNNEDGALRFYKISNEGKLLQLGSDMNEPESELYDLYFLTIKK